MQLICNCPELSSTQGEGVPPTHWGIYKVKWVTSIISPPTIALQATQNSQTYFPFIPIISRSFMSQICTACTDLWIDKWNIQILLKNLATNLFTAIHYRPNSVSFCSPCCSPAFMEKCWQMLATGSADIDLSGHRSLPEAFNYIFFFIFLTRIYQTGKFLFITGLVLS